MEKTLRFDVFRSTLDFYKVCSIPISVSARVVTFLLDDFDFFFFFLLVSCMEVFLKMSTLAT